MTENIELLGIWNNVTLPKSPLGRIKPYGYNLKQPILGLSSLTSQPKSGRDTVTGKQDGGRTPATISILCISLLKRCCTGGSKLPFSPIETKNPPRGIPKADFSLYKGFY